MLVYERRVFALGEPDDKRPKDASKREDDADEGN